MNELTHRLRPWFWTLLVVLAFAAYWALKPEKSTPSISDDHAIEQSAPDVPAREPQFENAWVCVWKTTLRKGEVIDFRNHEGPRVVVALNSGKITRIHKNGQRVTTDLKPGDAYWLEADPTGTQAQDMAESHEALQLMVVELQPELLKAWTYYKQERIQQDE